MSEATVPNPIHSDSDDEEFYENASSNLPSNKPIADTDKSTEEIINDIIGKQEKLDLADDGDDVEVKSEDPPAPKPDEELDQRRAFENTLSAAELLERKQKAIELKTTGNAQFKAEQYAESVESYTEGLAVCPLDCKEERSVLFGNRAAAHIQLGSKALAIQDCSDSLEANPHYIKVLLRRAKLFEETDKLDESLQDFKTVHELDRSVAEACQALVRLPPKIDERNEKLKTEMLGKLKDLGNMFLKPFGLSTNNFQMKQDPSTGSYSVNFNQNPGH